MSHDKRAALPRSPADSETSGRRRRPARPRARDRDASPDQRGARHFRRGRAQPSREDIERAALNLFRRRGREILARHDATCTTSATPTTPISVASRSC
jgi:hypothetical protein